MKKSRCPAFAPAPRRTVQKQSVLLNSMLGSKYRAYKEVDSVCSCFSSLFRGGGREKTNPRMSLETHPTELTLVFRQTIRSSEIIFRTTIGRGSWAQLFWIVSQVQEVEANLPRMEKTCFALENRGELPIQRVWSGDNPKSMLQTFFKICMPDWEIAKINKHLINALATQEAYTWSFASVMNVKSEAEPCYDHSMLNDVIEICLKPSTWMRLGANVFLYGLPVRPKWYYAGEREFFMLDKTNMTLYFSRYTGTPWAQVVQLGGGNFSLWLTELIKRTFNWDSFNLRDICCNAIFQNYDRSQIERLTPELLPKHILEQLLRIFAYAEKFSSFLKKQARTPTFNKILAKSYNLNGFLNAV